MGSAWPLQQPWMPHPPVGVWTAPPEGQVPSQPLPPPPPPFVAEPLPPAPPAPTPIPTQSTSAGTTTLETKESSPTQQEPLVAPVASSVPLIDADADAAPVVRSQPQVALPPSVQQVIAPSGIAPPTPPSPAVNHPLPPRPESSGLGADGEDKHGAFQNGKNFQQRNNTWRRKNGGRPPANIFGPQNENPESLAPGRFPPAPWAHHHKFAGGVPLPVSPPWETVPLRGQRNSNGFGYQNNKKGRRRDWYQVDGGYVSNDGSVIQHGAGMQHHFQRGQPGFVDPCNLIIRVS